MIATDASETLYLPPAYDAHVLAEGDPFEVACATAAEAGAGALFVRERRGVLAWALVLEPETPLAAARQVFPLAMAAVADAVVAHCLPERSVRIGWPDVVVYDTGRLGGGRLAWAEAPEADVPDWMVFGVELIADRDELPEPGLYPETTSLAEEAFEAPLRIVESFARNFMYRCDLWETKGYDAAVEDFLRRVIVDEGCECRVGPTGDLLLRRPDGRVEARRLVPALAACAWRDPARRGPRL